MWWALLPPGDASRAPGRAFTAFLGTFAWFVERHQRGFTCKHPETATETVLGMIMNLIEPFTMSLANTRPAQQSQLPSYETPRLVIKPSFQTALFFQHHLGHARVVITESMKHKFMQFHHRRLRTTVFQSGHLEKDPRYLQDFWSRESRFQTHKTMLISGGERCD